MGIRNLDYARALREAEIGIRRAAVFLGLGVNSAEDPMARAYLLSNHTCVELLPREVPNETLEQWKLEFRRWIVAGGFRELMEHLCAFFDRVYRFSTLALNKAKPKDLWQFERLGLDKKIEKLNEVTQICPYNGPLLGTLYPLRNCLVHRHGVVSQADLNDKAVLEFSYRRFTWEIQTDSGSSVSIPDLMNPKTLPFELPGGVLATKYEVCTYAFKKGQVIDLSPHTLSEILLFARICVHEYTQRAQQFALDNGVRIVPSAES